MKHKFTSYFIWSMILIIIAVDVVLAVNDIRGDTVSAVKQSWAYRFNILPFSWGVLTGHLFWYRQAPDRLWKILVLSGIGTGVLALDLLHHFSVNPIISVLVGVLAGHYLWNQRPRKHLYFEDESL